MSKARRKFDDKKQLTIFDVVKDYTTSSKPAEGECKIIDRLKTSIRKAIKASPLSRHQIAGEMGHLIGETITKEMIDSWTRESGEINGRPGRHVPAEYLPAFCRVTDDNGPMIVMGEAAGVFMLPGQEALRAEIQQLDEQITKTRARKKKRMVFLKEMEKRK